MLLTHLESGEDLVQVSSVLIFVCLLLILLTHLESDDFYMMAIVCGQWGSLECCSSSAGHLYVCCCMLLCSHALVMIIAVAASVATATGH